MVLCGPLKMRWLLRWQLSVISSWLSLRQKGLSLSIITVLSSLGLQELDELVENGSKCSSQKWANPVNPVSRAKVERDQVGTEGPRRVERTTSVVDAGQPVIR